jgi:hypothetical protein
MLGEDEPVHRNDPDGIYDYGPEDPAADSNPRGAGVIIGTPRPCPNCEQPLPPDGKCRSPYVDCQKSGTEPAKPLTEGASVWIFGGPWDGRYAIALGTVVDGRHCVQVCARSVVLDDEVHLADKYVHVVNPTVDEPVAKTGDPRGAESAARKRAPEPPKLVTEWAPDGRDFEGYAKDLGVVVNDARVMVDMFKEATMATTPEQRQARWGKPFKDWARARLSVP